MLRFLPAPRVLWNSLREEPVGNSKVTVPVLYLQSTHHVSAVVDGDKMRGRSDTCYKISLRSSVDPLEGLNVEPMQPLAAYDAPEVAQYLSPVIGTAAEKLWCHALDFDMRSLCYVVGAEMGAMMLGAQLPRSKYKRAEPRFFESGTVLSSGTEVVLTPECYRSDNVTLGLWAELLGKAGCEQFVLASKSAQIAPAVQRRARVIAMSSIANRVLSQAHLRGCLGNHVSALFRGMCATATLHAHCDEGGWLRRMLRTADYPVPSGVLHEALDDVGGFRPINTNDLACRSQMLAIYLTCVRAVSLADPESGTSVGQSVLLSYSDEEPLGRPSEISMLEQRTLR